MFSGIISHKIKVKNIEKKKSSINISLEIPKKVKLEEGESVNLNGICSTVVKIEKNSFDIQYMKETLDKTTVKEIEIGNLVNFEQSLKWQGKISGHFVSGHIDCMGKIISIKNNVFKIKISEKFLGVAVYKGSIAINGVSLTISKKAANYFEVSLIPYTLEHTNLDKLSVGDSVNIETDLLAKYKTHAKKRK